MHEKEIVRNKVLESDTKIFYETEDDFILKQFFKDTLRIGDNLIQISGKGVLNNTICSILMDKLDMVGIENHFIEKVNMREQLIQLVDVIPVRAIVNNLAYDRYVKDMGIEEGYVFDKPMIDLQIKNSLNGKYSPINEEQLTSFGWTTTKEIQILKNQSYRINDFLTGFFAGIGLRLVQIKLEFGRIFNGEEFIIMLVGDISPETCVLLNLSNNERLSIDDLTDTGAELNNQGLYIYNEIAKRLA
jgi:phosphoribosylaminoimidazole-succinocarboxamide synthase